MQAAQAGWEPEFAAFLHGGEVVALFFERAFAHGAGEVFSHAPDNEVVFEPGALFGEGCGFLLSFFHRGL